MGRTKAGEVTDWCILRCAGSQTLQLAASLNDAGFEAWSPAIVEVTRAGPSRTRRDVARAVIPGWVFVRADRMMEMVALSHSAMLSRVWDRVLRRHVDKGHHQFTVLGNGRLRPIPDEQLRHLRMIERKGAPKEVQRVYLKGDRVTLTEAGFEGLTGTVEATRGKDTWVTFVGLPSALRVPTWVLLSAEHELEKAA